ncbi:hypothetical protein MAR_016017 [Mya arenaria]|uniref:Uncharacterized protein n=1 Tax=Mya arenaria TaxID=6604 RepID=A0ABY7FMY7_MYAAR|nr:hypothetical protein MAR_016017 [Mya arenaria]
MLRHRVSLLLINPVRNQDLFDRLSYVFGKPLTRDKYRPSSKKHGDFDEESEDHDKQNRDIFKVKYINVRDASSAGNVTSLDVYSVPTHLTASRRKPSRTSWPAKHIPVGINWRKHLDCMSEDVFAASPMLRFHTFLLSADTTYHLSVSIVICTGNTQLYGLCVQLVVVQGKMQRHGA